MTPERFKETQLAGARKFVAGMKADNPEWSTDFAAGFEKGVMDTTAIMTAAQLWRITGERPRSAQP